jgi:rRNA maturation endonuclease Nob1
MGKHHFTIGKRQGGPLRCKGCRRTILYGDRCPDCQQQLRQRRKRKPR